MILFKVIKGLYLLFLSKLNSNKNKFYKERMAICEVCPIYKNFRCSENFYIGETVEKGVYQVVSVKATNKEKEPNIARKISYDLNQGCGCISLLKTQIKEEKCPANFW